MAITAAAVVGTAKIVGAILSVLGLIKASSDTGKSFSRSDTVINSGKSYDKYYKTLNSMGLNDIDPKDAIGQLYLAGEINADDYKSALAIIGDAERTYGDGYMNGLADFFGDYSYLLDNKKATHKQVGELYDKLTAFAPTIKRISNMSVADVEAAIYSGVKQAPNVAAPDYNDTNIDVNSSIKDVAPVKFWSGQELADLHNIDYDPNSYYDLIKQGTNEQVNLANFTSDQMNNASLYNDMDSRLSYLDSIRNNKSNAIATGTTLGQRAANEVLANKEAINTYAMEQADVADARMQAVDKALLADAEAKLSTRNYFDKLAQSLSQDSLTLYANDSNRFGQDWLSNAERYKANQALLSQNIMSNADMSKNYLSANAQINAYNKQASGAADEISWIFNNAVKAFDGNVWDAFNYTTNAIGKPYNNNNTIFEYLTSNK